MRHMKRLRRTVSLILCGVLLATALPVFPLPEAAAADTVQILSPIQAQFLAINGSKDITKKKNEITLKKVKYVESVAKIKAKIKNLKSFRWTPLLSFKFPQKLKLPNEFEMNVKPLELQSEITILQHAAADLEFDALEKVEKAYLKAYVTQEKVKFTESKLNLARAELARNQARLLTGDAKQSDIDKMTKSEKKLTNELSSLKRELVNNKKKLSDIIKLDISTGYVFTNPMFTARIPREELENLVQYTFEWDQGYFEAKMGLAVASMNLDNYLSLMKAQYGSKMDIIMPYVKSAKQGADVDYADFQLKYREMLKAIDEPWAGYIKILFFKFTKEWFKGEISGSRYIEDEMYAVYSASMEYGNALKERDSTEKELRGQVEGDYESIVSAGNAYQSLVADTNETRQDYQRLLALNKLGKADYEEVADKQKDYQEIQMETLDALASYNDLLISYDRLTCGAVYEFLRGEGVGLSSGESADSFKDVDPMCGPYYYLTNDVANLVFSFGIDVHDHFKPEITHFELWYEGTRLGERTPADQQLRHLMLDYGETSQLTVRLYSGDTYYGECVIDATVPRDLLDIKSENPEEIKTEEEIGSYKVSSKMVGTIKFSEIKLDIKKSVGAKSFTLTAGNGKTILTDQPVPIDKSFSYMTILAASLDEVQITLNDADGDELRKATFHTDDQTVWSPAQTAESE